MGIKVATITIKSQAPDILATFWRNLLGYVVVDHPTDSLRLDEPTGIGPTILVQPSLTGCEADAFHFDLRPTDQAEAVEKAFRLGATRQDVGQTSDKS